MYWARKNITQLAKYPRVLYVKPSNEVYLIYQKKRKEKISKGNFSKRIVFIFRLGAHDRTSNAGDEQDFQVEKIVAQPNYNQPMPLAHDISLLKLRQPAQMNNVVGMACLPGSSEQVSDGKMCWVTGNEC